MGSTRCAPILFFFLILESESSGYPFKPIPNPWTYIFFFVFFFYRTQSAIVINFGLCGFFLVVYVLRFVWKSGGDSSFHFPFFGTGLLIQQFNMTRGGEEEMPPFRDGYHTQFYDVPHPFSFSLSLHLFLL